jgi:hypothetical protein
MCRPVWLVLGMVVGCKRSTMMPAIPNATIERWVTAIDAVCDDMSVSAKQAYKGNPIAASAVEIRCRLAPTLDAPPDLAGGMIQLDNDDRASRMEFGAIAKPGTERRIARRLLLAYGLTEAVVDSLLAQPGPDRTLALEDLRVFVSSYETSGVIALNITLDNP